MQKCIQQTKRERVKCRRNKRGFTLIELLVVISIIGFLAAASVLAFNSARMKARDARRLADIRQLYTALEIYYDQNNRVPTTASYGENEPVGGGCNVSGWDCSVNDLNGNSFYFLDFLYPNVIKNIPLDPKNDLSHRYLYYYYPNGGGGCTGKFYVLQARGLETPAGKNDINSCFTGGEPNNYNFTIVGVIP